MTIAINVHKIAGSSFGSTLTTAGVTTIGGSGSIFVILTSQSQGSGVAPSSIADSNSNSYSLITSSTAGGFGGIGLFAYVNYGGTGGAGHTATANFAATDPMSLEFLEITGAATGTALDTSAVAADSGAQVTSATGASVTTTAPNDLILSYIATNSGANNTIADSGSGFSIVDRITATASGQICAVTTAIQALAGTYNDAYSWGTTDFWGNITLAFKSAAAAAIPIGPRLIFVNP